MADEQLPGQPDLRHVINKSKCRQAHSKPPPTDTELHVPGDEKTADEFQLLGHQDVRHVINKLKYRQAHSKPPSTNTELHVPGDEKTPSKCIKHDSMEHRSRYDGSRIPRHEDRSRSSHISRRIKRKVSVGSPIGECRQQRMDTSRRERRNSPGYPRRGYERNENRERSLPHYDHSSLTNRAEDNRERVFHIPRYSSPERTEGNRERVFHIPRYSSPERTEGNRERVFHIPRYSSPERTEGNRERVFHIPRYSSPERTEDNRERVFHIPRYSSPERTEDNRERVFHIPRCSSPIDRTESNRERSFPHYDHSSLIDRADDNRENNASRRERLQLRHSRSSSTTFHGYQNEHVTERDARCNENEYGRHSSAYLVRKQEDQTIDHSTVHYTPVREQTDRKRKFVRNVSYDRVNGPSDPKLQRLSSQNNTKYRDVTQGYRIIDKINNNEHLEPGKIIMVIVSNLVKFSKFMSSQAPIKNIQLFVKVLNKSVSTSLPSHRGKLIYSLYQHMFFDRKDIQDQLKSFLTKRKLDLSDEEFISDLLSLMKLMVELTGLTEPDTFICKLMLNTILNKTEDGLPHLKEKLEKVEELQRTKEESRNHPKCGTNNARFICEYDMYILPDIHMVRNNSIEDFAQPHKIGTPYDSELHYLRYIFCLFREDFIRPLCNGIRRYITQLNDELSNHFKDTDVRLFENVRFISQKCIKGTGIVWEIQLVNLRFHPSILKFGSLLCFSHDAFSTLLYATVANRDAMSLKKGIIHVQFIEDDSERVSTLEQHTFVMLESHSFYPAYIHTLKTLKNVYNQIKNQSAHLPLKQFLTGCNVNTRTPKYLEMADEVSFDGLLQYGNSNKRTSETSCITDLRQWPTADELGFDESQYGALQMALTKEIALIQGPPGTGKTLIGIRLAEFLLDNHELWNTSEEGLKRPLLLISYTNHAVDQFLNELIRTPTMQQCPPSHIVRVGSRCESEELEQFNLKTHRRTKSRFHMYRNETENCTEKFDLNSRMIEQYKHGLVHEGFLKARNAISPVHYEQLVSLRTRYDNGPRLLVWLDINAVQTAQDTELDFEEGELLWTVEDIYEEDRERILDDNENEVRGFNVDDIDTQLDIEEGELVSTEEDIYEKDRERILDEDRDFNMNDLENETFSEDSVDETLPDMALNECILTDTPYWQQVPSDKKIQLFNAILKAVNKNDIMSFSDVERVRNIWQLNASDRWKLYRYWIWTATAEYRRAATKAKAQFEETHQLQMEARAILDVDILREARVVAMTTTGAAQHASTLQIVAPAVVIIEEAAQAAEQHVVSALSKSCQHLIMIGDHQQLQPSFNDYELCKKFKTDVSLFERLIKSGMEYKQLQLQHRMRPEISFLLKPHIYQHLKDHTSVFNRANICGMSNNLFFLDHDHLEDRRDGSLSHRNKHEANMVAKLYRHLRLQNYSPEDITILTTYKDQVYLLRHIIQDLEENDRIIKMSHFSRDGQKVRITAVDNYQGEENKIIILSLVRSNIGKKIGYLSRTNRICVALSRAREGLYVIGNMSLLREKSKTWENILSKAEETQHLGKVLQLKCQKHAFTNDVKTPEDFDKSPDGGCKQRCDTRLKCGHACSRYCHIDTETHYLPCTKACTKRCKRGHPCLKQCCEECGHCKEYVTVELPSCGHTQEMQCYKDPRLEQCEERCTSKLPCGHICQKKCGQPCNTPDNCMELIKIDAKCGHCIQIACCTRLNPKCSVPCDKILKCGHKCKGTCEKCFRGNIHQECKEKCSRVLICGHVCKHKCNIPCSPCTLNCERICHHSMCGDKCGDVCVPCQEPCKWRCRRDCPNKYKCSRTCDETCDRPRCNRPCKKRLKCGHPCIGFYCEPCFCLECEKGDDPTEIFFGTEDEQDAIFYKLYDCPHIFESSGLDTYMDQMNENSIGLKVCPKCKTPVFNSNRYNNVIKAAQRDIDVVKKKIILPTEKLQEKKMGILKKFHTVQNWQLETAKNTRQLDTLEAFLENRKTFEESILSTINEIKASTPWHADREFLLKSELKTLLEWVEKQNSFTEQQAEECQMEILRIKLLYKMYGLQELVREKDEDSVQDDKVKIEAEIQHLDKTKLLKSKSDELQTFIAKTHKKYQPLALSEEEKIMVKKAMGFSNQGHWFKCKNGHVYAITECGGAMERSRCPDCKEVIGGERHALAEGNTVAGEMDGARFGAWSEQANMQNYDLN